MSDLSENTLTTPRKSGKSGIGDGGTEGLKRRKARLESTYGDVAQLGERLVCNQEVAGSTPVVSTQEIEPFSLRLNDLRRIRRDRLIAMR